VLSDKVWDVVVVGAGAAGMTASIACAETGLRTQLLDRLGPGGELLSIPLEVADGRSGQDIADDLIDLVGRSPIEFGMHEVIAGRRGADAFELMTTAGFVQAQNVIIATGTEARRLAIPGAAELEGRGVSYCASCDGPSYAGRTVALVADDQWSGVQVRALAECGTTVIIVAPESRTSQDLGLNPERDAARIDAVAVRVTGEDTVRGLVIDDGSCERTLDVPAVFGSVGRVPQAASFEALVDLDSCGRILTDHQFRTRTPALFAIGDVRSSVASTAAAALSAGRAVAAFLTARNKS
jgi:thioredoxin reductase (NADPH)